MDDLLKSKPSDSRKNSKGLSLSMGPKKEDNYENNSTMNETIESKYFEKD